MTVVAVQAVLMTAIVGMPATPAPPAQASAPRPQWKGLDGVDLIPCPKRIRLTGERLKLVADGRPAAVIVVPDSEHATARIGADEVNERVGALTGVRLPVQTASQFKARPAAEAAVAIDCPAVAGFATAMKRKQGYEIRSAGQHVVGVSGVDAPGALYGCVTLRRLITGGKGRAALRCATVADWPDFRQRATDGLSLVGHMFGRGRYSFEEALRRGKAGVDWALRRKFSMVRAPLPEGVSPPTDRRRARIVDLYKQLCAYAAARAVRVLFMTHAKIGTVASHRTDARFADLKRFRDYYFCWSRDAMIAESAAGVTEFVKAVGPQAFYFHFPDIHENNWAKRCERCRKRFGDDRAAADANVINALARAVRAGHPDALAVFVMQPYRLNFDLAQNARWRRYYSRLSELIPADVHLCQRECSDEEARSWRRTVRQPRLYYHEPQAFIPRRPFTTSTRFARTFYFDDDRDIYYSSVPCTTLPMFRIQELATAEFAWNTHAPGAELIRRDPSGVVWSGREGDYCRERRRVGRMAYREWLWREGASEPREVGVDLLTRACRLVYGPEAAEAMAAGHRSGVSTEPELWGGPASLGTGVRAAIADGQRRRAAEACAVLDALYEQRETLDAHTRMVYGRLLKLNHVFKTVADVQRHVLRARALAASGKKTEALAEVAAGRRAQQAGRKELTAAFKRFKLDAVADNYRLRCGKLADALGYVARFDGALALLEKELHARGADAPSRDLLLSCTFDADRVEAAFARSTGKPLAATSRGVDVVADGKSGQAARFAQTGACHLPAPGNLDPHKGAIEMWVKPNWAWNDNRRHVFFTARGEHDGWARNRLHLMKNVNYSLNFGVAGRDGKGVTAAVKPNMFRKGQWTHLAASWDSTRGVKLFVNGVLAAEAKGRWRIDVLKRIWLGSEPTGKLGADAILDDVRIRGGQSR